MTALNKQAHKTENERMAQSLAERNGEPVEGLRQRISELEEIATDYGMKFQKSQDALKHQALLHKFQLEDAEKRISDLETKKANLMAHVLNGYEATALTMTLRKMDVYLPDYLRFCAIYGVDHDAIMDKLDYQSFVLARVNNDDLRQDIEASHD